jgi:hypothetical protein
MPSLPALAGVPYTHGGSVGARLVDYKRYFDDEIRRNDRLMRQAEAKAADLTRQIDGLRITDRIREQRRNRFSEASDQMWDQYGKTCTRINECGAVNPDVRRKWRGGLDAALTVADGSVLLTRCPETKTSSASFETGRV